MLLKLKGPLQNPKDLASIAEEWDTSPKNAIPPNVNKTIL